MTSTFFIGVDGGGSKTAAVVTDEQLKVLGEGVAGPSNFLRVGMAEAMTSLEKALSAAADAAKVRLDDAQFCYLGIAGADHPKHRAALVTELRRLFPRENFTVDNDARIALTGATGLGGGVVVIAGTGSVAFGRNERGVEARAGGWGPTLGDEGSGYSIARRGLAAIVRAYDGRGPKTAMIDILCNHYDMCRPEDLPFFVYAPSTHADDIARYCRLVIEAATAQDPVAMRIFQEEGRELGLTAVAVARKLDLCGRKFRLAYVGGSFRAGKLLLDPFTETVLSACPGAEIGPPLATPVLGAAQMAVRAASLPRVR
jgi:N-acetylglucosamine kinase-like BadF-type ATPase